MKLSHANEIGEKVLERMELFIEKGSLAGSTRRKKSEVNDVDIVILPKKEFMILNNIKNVLKKYGSLDVEGNKIIRTKSEKGIKIDCYIADEKNYEVLLLIRTGSKEHNKKIAAKALKQGKKLSFSEGLIDVETKKVIANTEKGIFKALGMEYVEPENRN